MGNQNQNWQGEFVALDFDQLAEECPELDSFRGEEIFNTYGRVCEVAHHHAREYEYELHHSYRNPYSGIVFVFKRIGGHQ